MLFILTVTTPKDNTMSLEKNNYMFPWENDVGVECREEDGNAISGNLFFIHGNHCAADLGIRVSS